MSVLKSALDPHSENYRAAESAMRESLAELTQVTEQAMLGGSESSRARHLRRGKLLAADRVNLLLDEGSPFLDLCTLAGYGSDFAVGGSAVGGIGLVSGIWCVINANDPTVRGGSINPLSAKKSSRIQQIARQNRLPYIMLVESGGADLPTQKDIFIPGGAAFRNLTQMSAAGIPTIAVVFGNSTAGGAYMPGMSDHVIMIEGRSKVFLGGPPLVKAATGEVSDDESLGGAAMHARVSGLADHYAVDEPDALRIARQVVADLNLSATPTPQGAEPLHDPEELLGVVPPDLKTPFDPREIIARIADGSEFSEFKAEFGQSLVTGWLSIHGHRLGILANARGVLFSAEAQKATQFIQLANASRTPLLFCHNTTGFMVGKEYERGGIIKHGAMMINAVSNSTVPHLTLIPAASYGAGNYGMSGRAFDPRFLFTWPSSRSAVMGAQQLADVTVNVARASARGSGREWDEASGQAMHEAIERQITAESQPLFMSGMVYDDGVIDPRDTRTVLGICLTAIANGLPEPRTAPYGIFRM